MRAIVIDKPGGPEVLQLREVATPVPARGEVRVRIRATAVNRADLLQRMGAYPAPADAPADIPGLEYAGEIDALGDGVTELRVGDRVFGLAGGGTYAEQLVVHAVVSPGAQNASRSGGASPIVDAEKSTPRTNTSSTLNAPAGPPEADATSVPRSSPDDDGAKVSLTIP